MGQSPIFASDNRGLVQSELKSMNNKLFDGVGDKSWIHDWVL